MGLLGTMRMLSLPPPSKVGVNGAKAVANYGIAITHQSGLPKRHPHREMLELW